MAVYATEAQLEKRMSVQGVTLYTDDDLDGSRDDGVVEFALEESSGEIDLYLNAYDPSYFAANRWVVTRCLDIAVWTVCSRRNGPIPSSVQFAYAKTMETLQAIYSGSLKVPNMPYRNSHTPSVTNVRVDPRFPSKKIRVERRISTEPAGQHPVSVDWAGEFDYDPFS